jgi:hypothetical protein
MAVASRNEKPPGLVKVGRQTGKRELGVRGADCELYFSWLELLPRVLPVTSVAAESFRPAAPADLFQ